MKATIQDADLCIMTPCSDVVVYQLFKILCCLYFQGQILADSYNERNMEFQIALSYHIAGRLKQPNDLTY